ncbi:ThuA domain-containing protein [Streptosporangium sp. NPDC050855]|uniref:ThuA domain-containing protein n=1 Tax=Streptosporangium sp. NPDC050855 TaxID=3366194 RepID=UPI0037AD73FE
MSGPAIGGPSAGTGPGTRTGAGTRTALVVRGGWEGHAPVEATELFIPELTAAGFSVTVTGDLEVYADRSLLAGTDLIVQCWTDGVLTPEQEAGLVAAVEDGTGFAGWHGGVVAAFGGRDYLRMVGGLFLHHPDDFLTYDVSIDPAHSGHPIVAGLGDFTVETEQYWMLADARNEVLATTVFVSPPTPMPVVWTRRWGRGKVFFSAIGHRLDDLRHPTVYELTRRGLVWAAR